MDVHALGRSVGLLLIGLGAALLLPLSISLYYGERAWAAFLLVQLAALLIGAALHLLLREHREPHLQGTVLAVAIGAAVACLVGAMPLWLSGAAPRFLDALFEAVSGFTTTGASVLPGLARLPRGVLLWRSLMQWLGGMAMVLLAVAVLPRVGVGAVQLLSTQRASSAANRLTPRVRESVRLLSGIYVLISAAAVLALLACGLSPFDAICHAFSTVSTGGFSTREGSIAALQSLPVELVTIVFMLLGGTNFALLLLLSRGQWRTVLRDQELRTYLALTAAVALVMVAMGLAASPTAAAQAVRTGLLRAVSTTTTAGFAATDPASRTGLVQAMLVMLMLIGGCAGSTAGGLKIVRVLLLLRHARNELRKLLHPHAVYALRYNGHAVTPDAFSHVVGLFLLLLAAGTLGTLAMTATGLDLPSAIGAVAATLGNTGTAFGAVGQAAGFAAVSPMGKWILIFCMLLGRLELLTLLVLLTPDFWRRV
jgi:trk system potassium uptake protein TrkH